MKKIVLKNSVTILTTGIMAVVGIFVGASQAFAEIPGKYLAADMSGDDLLGIAKSHPYLFWTVSALLVIGCIGYGIYHLTKKKEVI